MHKTPKMLKRPVRIIQQLFRIIRFCRRTTPLWSTNYPRVFLQAVRLCREKGFSPKEAFRLGLFNPTFSPDEISKYISRKKMTKVQETINPVSWTPLIRDKSIFYRYCMALDIPVPKLYAIFCKRTTGWAYNGSVLANRDDWKKFLNAEIPSEFVIKPSVGSFGRGLNIFSRTADGFIDAFRSPYRATDIFEAMSSNPQYDSFVIQERLESHPELVRLSGTEFLQTVRITTFVDRNNLFHILHASFKPIVGRNVIDNFEHGQTGNVLAEVCLHDGTLKSAVTIAPNGLGIKSVPAHPKTGIPFQQFQLPFWTEARALVKETAFKFLPVRTVGWDIAMTPEGPFVLEGNNCWEPPNTHRCMDIILDVLSCDSHSLIPKAGKTQNLCPCLFCQLEVPQRI